MKDGHEFLFISGAQTMKRGCEKRRSLWRSVSEWGLALGIVSLLPSIYSYWRNEFISTGRHSRMLGQPETQTVVLLLIGASLLLSLVGLLDRSIDTVAIFIVTILLSFLSYYLLDGTRIWYA